MNKENTFSKEDLVLAVNANKAKAEEYFNEPSKITDLLSKVKAWLKKYKKTPVIGKVFEDIVAIVDLITDYFNKEYTEIPKASIISAIAALIYVVSPIDLIPDLVPVVGVVDDVAVVLLVLELGLSRDLSNYKKWKQSKIDERLISETDSIAERINRFINYETVAGVFILDEKSVKILTDSEENYEKPFECYAYIFEFNESDFSDEDIITPEDKLNFIIKVFNNEKIKWNETCIGRIMPVHKCTDFDEFYYVIDRED